MKPKPLASLNHLTFPDVLIVNLLSVLPSEIKRSSSSRAGKSLLYRSQRAGTKANSAPPSFERRLPAGFPVKNGPFGSARSSFHGYPADAARSSPWGGRRRDQRSAAVTSRTNSNARP